MSVKQVTSLRMSPELKRALKQAADTDRRSFGAYVEIVLENHVKALAERSLPLPKEE